ncbi:hypothetical protein [Nitratiruptor sp. YY09-18]|uniref:hypothetical protein n=1 Tax=Nitratiruptor sp. YY09-18 TaxID=2724901 RepID=UPI0019165CAC|nr:hypothetical protein [Nitratiruptor sp. YY09-18]BCD67712.1 hypothetical protein NitYY0918_C0613 [Nitratiruptor sp. YY09-18]
MKKDRYIRSKYIRELERFVNRIVDFFQTERTKEQIDAHIAKIFAPLEDIETTYLQSEYLKELEKFVERNANLHLSEKEASQIQEDVLKEANLLRKLKRKKSFAKEKHRGKSLLED